MLRLPLEMGICDYQEGHPEDAWETMSNAPWGVRLACRLLQERSKGDDSEWAPYLALIPPLVPGQSSSIHTTIKRLNSSVLPFSTNEKHVFPSVKP